MRRVYGVKNMSSTAKKFCEVQIADLAVGNETTKAAVTAFRGEALGRWYIPAADKGSSGVHLEFRDFEVLRRFTTLSRENQHDLLKAIREEMENSSVPIVDLKVRWSKDRVRTLRFSTKDQYYWLDLLVELL